MKIRTKRIIAREFLLVLSCFLGAGVFLGAVCLYSVYLEGELKDLEAIRFQKRITEKETRSEYRRKIEERNTLINSINSEFDFGNLTDEDLWKRLYHYYLVDSIDYQWNVFWDKEIIYFFKLRGLKNATQLKEFIKGHSISKTDIENKEAADLIKKELEDIEVEISALKNKVPQYTSASYYLVSLGVLSIVLFPVRYLALSIKWSIDVLRTKE